MSRSYLHDRYMKKQFNKNCERNEHRMDEAPKNKPSKEILKYCDISKVYYCEHPPVGHARTTGGKRQVNGIVRAGRKEETRKLIDEQINEKEQD